MTTLTPWQQALDHGDVFYVAGDPHPHVVDLATADRVQCRCGGFYLRSSCCPEPTA